MSLTRWQRTIVNEAGDVIDGAEVEVFKAGTTDKPDLFQDSDGNDVQTNPFNADSNGFAAFYVEGGLYDIAVNDVTLWTDVALGDVRGRNVGSGPNDVPDNSVLALRERIERDATLLLDFENNRYRIYEGLADGNTEKSYSDIVTHTRASDATGFNALGTLSTVTSDTQRLVYSPETGRSEGLLVEEERTNVLLNSDAPATQTVTVSDATTHTLSVIGDGSAEITQGGSGTASEDSPLTFDTTGTTVEVTVSGSLDYFQLEQASTASSMIITGGTAVTRAADVVSQDEVGKWLNENEGSFFVEAEYIGPDDQSGGVFGISDGSNNNRISIFFNPSERTGGDSDHIAGFITKGGSNSVLYSNVDGTNSEVHRVLLTYNSSQFSIYVDGVGFGPETSSGTASDLTKLDISDNLKVSCITKTPYALTESEAIAITQPEE